jgi:hypothetical protein
MPADRARWRAGARFAGIVLATTAVALVALDWVLFDIGRLADRLAVAEVDSARGKLLMAAHFGDARVVYLGDSRTLTDVDPRVVSAVCECGPGFSAAFSSADTVLTRVVAGRLLETMAPDAVVIGLSQWWLSDQADIKVFFPAREVMPAWRMSEFGGFPNTGELLSSAVASVWRLYRYRTEVRTTVAALAGSPPVEFRNGFLPRTERPSPAKVQEQAPIVKTRGFSRFAVAGRRTAALRDLLADLRARSIPALLVALPLHPTARRLVADEVERFRVALFDLAREADVACEDLTAAEWIGEEDFADNVHLNEHGAMKFSRYLGRQLREELRARRAV